MQRQHNGSGAPMTTANQGLGASGLHLTDLTWLEVTMLNVTMFTIAIYMCNELEPVQSLVGVGSLELLEGKLDGMRTDNGIHRTE